MTAAKARGELRAVILEAAPVITLAAVEVILAAADEYRDAGPDHGDDRVAHLNGPGMGTACRLRWQRPELLRVTGNPRAVTCAKCRRSLRYRSLTGGGTT